MKPRNIDAAPLLDFFCDKNYVDINTMFVNLKLIPSSRVFLLKLRVAKKLNKFSVYYGARRSITVLTRARHWCHTLHRSAAV
jgi:hypothetical protein